MYALTAVASSLSAFLLFFIQPAITKELLPYFGGASNVWITGLVFFTGMLTLGYAYVVVLTRLSAARQILVHVSLVACAIAASFLALGAEPVRTTIPQISILLTLGVSIGLGYLVLAATGPLLQYWWGQSHGKDPYSLYALSNAGSLAALIAYPLLIERFSTLGTQRLAWAIGLTLAGSLVALALWRLPYCRVPMAPVFALPPLRDASLWIVLALLPAAALAATTNFLTNVVAPVPLLWMLPLGIYLATFIAAFAGLRMRLASLIVLGSSVVLTYLVRDDISSPVWLKTVASMGVLGSMSLIAHTMLYAKRPTMQQLPSFYLALSLGGVVGTLLVAVVAPSVFPDFWEFPIILAVGALMVLAYPLNALRGHAHWRWPLAIALTPAVLLVLVALGTDLVRDIRGSLHASRNFYGAVKVSTDGSQRYLYNGTTMHGSQFTDPGREFLPSSYYSPETGLGRAIMHARSLRDGHSISVDAIGLGAGVIAGYCVAGDAFRFYEIDARIEHIAREYFTFLGHCPDATIGIGDGRLLLMDAEDAIADVLVVDAFTDDAIPTHLITRQAMEQYVRRVGETGIIALHISNRYLDLLPVALGHAQALGLSILYVENGYGANDVTAPSRWVLLTRDPGAFSQPIFANAASVFSRTDTIDWTDEFSDIISLLIR